MAFLRGLGFEDVGIDHARKVGRGEGVGEGDSGLQALCGQCWRGSLCVAPDATVSPCVFSKAWSIGSAIESDLSDLVGGTRLREVRELIRTDVWMPRQAADNSQGSVVAGECEPSDCTPTGCCPENIARPINSSRARSAPDHSPV